MKLFQPARCTASLAKNLDKPYYVCEEKLDGSRYLLYLGYNPYVGEGCNALLSRRS
jgi:hypothetical protein